MDDQARLAPRAAQALAIRRRRTIAGLLGLAIVALVAILLVVGVGGGGRGARPPRAPAIQATATPPTPTPTPTTTSDAAARPRASERVALARLAATGLPVYCGGRAKPLVALTFDDGPGVYTKLALRKLRAHGLRATFFLVGKSINSFPGLARLERPVGAVGDHTLTHPFLPGLSQSEMIQQIAAAKTLIGRNSGQPVELFRPPYGARTAAIDAEAKALGLVEVLWTADSQDSLGADYAGIAHNVVAALHPGWIILMHENRGQTIRALATIIPALARSRLRTVTVPELLAEDPPTPAQLRAGGLGCGLGAAPPSTGA